MTDSPLVPPVPRGDEIGRLNTPGHVAYLKTCRICHGDLVDHRGVMVCPFCDRLPASMTNGPAGWHASKRPAA